MGCGAFVSAGCGAGCVSRRGVFVWDGLSFAGAGNATLTASGTILNSTGDSPSGTPSAATAKVPDVSMRILRPLRCSTSDARGEVPRNMPQARCNGIRAPLPGSSAIVSRPGHLRPSCVAGRSATGCRRRLRRCIKKHIPKRWLRPLRDMLSVCRRSRRSLRG